MTNHTMGNCSQTPPQPPTTSPFVAIPIGGPNSTILDACCGGVGIATYGHFESKNSSYSSCYQYCNTTALSCQDSSVYKCVASGFQGSILCGDGEVQTSAGSRHGPRGASKLLLSMIGMGIVGTVLGMA
ncbi:hypothetical protein K469DRAFT_693220 [Zopfia rhizophila CBS 207.26]|uniref:Uncharacterized protein n=1 Tax=Zopfia rhizophila CBS 207.26 TaxID=1314779 RepID=A0A6A6ETH2_9PEZI|nr:hypothetical protein K469DRAFT_693220 [Zopfia rhizophila CBS 207.26]